MIASNFLRSFLRFMSEPFYYYQWTGWKVLAIAMPVLVLLSMIIIWRRKERARRAEMDSGQILEHSHVIGAKLAKRKHYGEEIADIGRDLSANIRDKLGKHQSWKETTGRFEKLNREIDQLQHEIAKHEQTEAQLDQKVAKLTPSNEWLQSELDKGKQIEAQLDQKATDLTACNEQLEQELAESRQIEMQLSQEIAGLTACNEQFQQQTSETRDAETYLKQQFAESQATNEQLKSRISENKQIEEALKLTARLGVTDAPRQLGGVLEKNRQQVGMSNQSETPLDVEALQAIAVLIKQIQGRPAQN